MTVPALPEGEKLLCIARGRSMVFSPAWDEDGVSVLFDRNSGDYWVVTPLARQIVSDICAGGPVSWITNQEETPPPGIKLDGSSSEMRCVIAEMVQLGILAQTGN